MTGRKYYLTTRAAWQRHAPRWAEVHFIVLNAPGEQGSAHRSESSGGATRSPSAEAAPILALITADEAAHIVLESDPEFEALPHPLARTPVSERVAGALAALGVLPGHDTFTVAEKLGLVNPLLRHRVF